MPSGSDDSRLNQGVIARYWYLRYSYHRVQRCISCSFLVQWAVEAIISAPLTAQVISSPSNCPFPDTSIWEQSWGFSQTASVPNSNIRTSSAVLSWQPDRGMRRARSEGWSRNGFCGVSRGLSECLHVWVEQKENIQGVLCWNCWVMLWRASNCGVKSAPKQACVPQHPAFSCCRRQPSRPTALPAKASRWAAPGLFNSAWPQVRNRDGKPTPRFAVILWLPVC